jgi:hypothetical protein
MYNEPSPIEMQIGGSPIPLAMGCFFFYDAPMDGSEMFFELSLPHLLLVGRFSEGMEE